MRKARITYHGESAINDDTKQGTNGVVSTPSPAISASATNSGGLGGEEALWSFEIAKD